AYGEDTALLAGDALVIHAFEIAARSAAMNSAEKTVRVIHELAFASGFPGMVGGQILDMAAQHHGVDREGLLAVHHAKTGALIRGAVRAGAIIAGATDEQLKALTEYGEEVGLVFQITDDILDAETDDDPISFPALYGMEESKKMAQESTAHAVELLAPFGEAALPLKALAEYLLYRSV
ncbi:MAG: polyprenyl synthetase family protein, partial [bacterium]|nr:polyprenyl synthetase family protein [bacterium]